MLEWRVRGTVLALERDGDGGAEMVVCFSALKLAPVPPRMRLLSMLQGEGTDNDVLDL